MKLLQRNGRPQTRAATGQPVLAMLALLALLLLTLAGPIMTMNGGDVEGQGRVYRQLGYFLIAGLAFISVNPLRHPERVLAVAIPLVVALAWCWISLTWALYPEIAVRRLVLTTIVLWSVFVLVRQLGYDRTLAIVRIALLAALIANFTAVLIDPLFAIHGSEEGLAGDWRGVMMHKNIAGQACALTAIFFAFDRQKLPLAAQLGVIGAAVMFLVLSNSKTAMAACAIAIPAGFLFLRFFPVLQRAADRIGRRRHARWIAILVPVAILTAALFLYRDSALSVLNDPAAFTGRTLIWRALFLSFLENPVLGVGYGSYWNVGPAGPIYRYANFAWVEGVSQGHNGYLDLLVQIGLPGLLLVLFAVVVWPVRRMLGTPDLPPATAGLIGAVILFCLIHNGSESTLFDRDTIGQVFLMVVLALAHAGRVSVVRTGSRAAPVALDLPKRESRLRL
ncbi:O-antigen ligase family protein [Sphingomonas prati]|uniref:O-antigen ligase n=1 Tax=Sphingomonas prati TaxID=1843237 RepID=A0A7W9BSC3_9SPHN|nr:O-antigen ligase family protein [Sphingomonas prati]MBB5729254.1 O-antigen ligase [Sphingomonas prati]GGE83940.1 hypothetical protein GCM10011404_15740 [Sphingomonas prati]